MQALNVRSHGTQIALVVTWRPPSDITNPTGYRLRYHKTSSSTWSSTRTIGSQQTQHTITGLEEGATYEVEVWAYFSSGEGSRRRFTARTSSGFPYTYHAGFSMVYSMICCAQFLQEELQYKLQPSLLTPLHWSQVLLLELCIIKKLAQVFNQDVFPILIQ